MRAQETQRPDERYLQDLMGKKLFVTEVNEILTSSNRTLNNAEDHANQLNGQFTADGSNARCKLSYDTY